MGREVSGGAGKCTAVRACPGGAAGSGLWPPPRRVAPCAGRVRGPVGAYTGRDGPGRAGPAGAALSRLPGP